MVDGKPYSSEDRDKYLKLFQTAYDLLVEKKFKNLEARRDTFYIAVEEAGSLVKEDWVAGVVEQAGSSSFKGAFSRVRSAHEIQKLHQNAENWEPIGS